MFPMFVEVTTDVCKKDSVYSLFRAQYLHIRKLWRASVNAMTGVEDASSRGLGHQHELRHLGEEDPGGHRVCLPRMNLKIYGPCVKPLKF